MDLKPMFDLFKGTDLEDRLSKQSKLLESVNNKIIKGANDCAQTTCNTNGFCFPIADKWLSESDPPKNFITLYKNYECICKNPLRYNQYPFLYDRGTDAAGDAYLQDCSVETSCSDNQKRNFSTGKCEECGEMRSSLDLVTCSYCQGSSTLINGKCDCPSEQCFTKDLTAKTCTLKTDICQNLEIGEYTSGPLTGQKLYLVRDSQYTIAASANPDSKVGLYKGYFGRYWLQANNRKYKWKVKYNSDFSIEIVNEDGYHAYMDYAFDIMASTTKGVNGKFFIYDVFKTINRGNQKVKLFKINANRNGRDLFVNAETMFVKNSASDDAINGRFFFEEV